MSNDRCYRCGRKLGRRSWEMSLTSLFGTPTAAYITPIAAYIDDFIPAYRHNFEICEECAADLRKFMRVDERKCSE